MVKKILLAYSFFGLNPSLLHACAVCFGGADSNLKKGFTWGIVVLGSLPFILLVGFIFTIALSTRKHRHR